MRVLLVILALALLLLPGSSFAQVEPEVRAFTEFTGKGVEAQDYEFTVSGYKYTILGYGQGKREDSKGFIRSFKLPLNSNYLDAQIQYADYRGDVLLICETSDSEYGIGFITRLDGRTLKMKWKRTIPGFNLGQGLLESNHAYVTAIGFVGKVNLETGTYAWKRNELYKNSQQTGRYSDDDFNSFELPKLEGEAVLFTEQDTYRNPPQTLKVNKRTGKIIANSPPLSK